MKDEHDENYSPVPIIALASFTISIALCKALRKLVATENVSRGAVNAKSITSSSSPLTST